eukprot:m.24975 g.24975  ORF g.24975 m.24975 type:complete len:699 (+) comp13487_c0_seq1:79-2175(+)
MGKRNSFDSDDEPNFVVVPDNTIKHTNSNQPTLPSRAKPAKPPSASDVAKALKAHHLDSTDGHSHQGLCTVSIDNLMSLITSAAQDNTKLPFRAFVASSLLHAKAMPDCIKLEGQFQVQVLEPKWTLVKLLPASVALLDVQVILENADDSSPAVATVVLYNGVHCLLSNFAGAHVIRIKEALCPYSGKAKSGFDMAYMPQASKTELSLTIPAKGIDISVNPSLKLDFQSTDEDDFTKATAIVPACSNVNVRWSLKDVEEAIPADTPSLAVNIDQNHLLTFGDTVCEIMSVFNYDIRNGVLPFVEISISSPDVRVITVDGDHVKHFTTHQAESRTLKVLFDHGVEGKHTVVVHSEIPLEDGQDLVLPCFSHGLNGREIGFVGVEARASVEIQEITDGNLAVDLTELPSIITEEAESALLLAFKFLTPVYDVVCQVKKHADLSVLVCAIDSCHATITKTSNGRTMKRMVFSIRNTQMQFLRLKIGAQADIWSTVVASRPVKPARDGEYVLLPLQKKTSEAEATFGAEIVWVEEGPPLTAGVWTFEIPEMNIPANSVMVTLCLSSEFGISTAAGDLKQVKRFRRSVPAPPRVAPTNTYQATIGVMEERAPQQMQQQAFTSAPRSLWGQRRNKRKGVLPVTVQALMLESAYYFERLLVKNEGLSVRVQVYKQLTSKDKLLRAGAVAALVIGVIYSWWTGMLL